MQQCLPEYTVPSSLPITKLLTSPCGKAKHVAAIAFDCFVCNSNASCGCDSMSRLHEHNLPSVEILIRLCAFCVPTTLKQYTGCCRRNNDFLVFIFFFSFLFGKRRELLTISLEVIHHLRCVR